MKDLEREGLKDNFTSFFFNFYFEFYFLLFPNKWIIVVLTQIKERDWETEVNEFRLDPFILRCSWDINIHLEIGPSSPGRQYGFGNHCYIESN